MSGILRILLITGAIFNLGFVLIQIRKNKLKIEDSIFWFFLSFILIVLALFPGIVELAANFIGIQSPVNLLYLIVLFVVLTKLFSLTIRISKADEKIKELTQTIGIWDKKL
jgi:hypothetical protein